MLKEKLKLHEFESDTSSERQILQKLTNLEKERKTKTKRVKRD